MTVRKQRAARDGRHAVVLIHPDPPSFDHAIAARYRDDIRASSRSIVRCDLYAMHVDPVPKAEERPTLADPIPSPEVTAEREVLAGCDVFVLIYPIWFGSPPAMMKGYVERVFGTGVVPDDVRKQVRGDLLGDKRLLSFSTSALSKVWLAQEGQEMGLGSVFDDYIVHAFGMHSREHKRFALITDQMDQRSVDTYLWEVAQQAHRTCAQVAFGDEALMHDPQLARQFNR